MFTTRPRSRTHPFQFPAFWGLIAFGVAAWGAWKFELVPLSLFVSHEQLHVPEEDLPPPPEGVEPSNRHLIHSQTVDAPAVVQQVIPPPSSSSISVAQAEPSPAEVQLASASNQIPARNQLDETTEAARQLAERGDEIGALRLLSELYWQHPELRDSISGDMNLLANRIYFETTKHYLPPHRIDFGDRLETIARKYDVTWEYLARLNGLDPHRIKSGETIKVLPGPFEAVIDLSRQTLTVHSHGYFVREYRVQLGIDQPAPRGQFHVVDKVTNPTYYGLTETISEADPANPLGEYWIALNDEAGTLSGFGIHGMNAAAPQDNRGFIRLSNDDVNELFDLLTIGAKVSIRQAN
ncbi:MAG: LysM peptidoglycan-binding domain-containing protein [Planctomycetaceae bacterium]|nr:LysM peptidoglycan-binding domain-containing protein [Planctomycetaceae bacterium]